MAQGSKSTWTARTRRPGTLFHRALAVLAIALFVLAAGCGDDDGGEGPTLESYLQRMEGILQDSNQQFADLGDQGLSPEGIQDPQQAVALEEQAREIIAGAFGQIRALEAPEEVGREHEELVVAANNYVHELDVFIGQLQEAQTVDDVQTLFENIPGSPLDEAASRLDTSCLQLQDVATARGIGVDLGCGE
jgi:hypothetical protein